MPDSKLPSRRESPAWKLTPPNPLDDPDLYDGIIVRRVVGYAIDVLILLLIGGALWIALWILAIISLGLLSPLFAIAAILPLLYHSFFIGSGGATPGMRAMDVEVRTWTGLPPSYAEAFIQTAVFYVTVPPTSALILLVALFNDRHRTLHDFLSGTVVVRRQRLLAGQAAPS
ncbi:MAG: RDD family protein [Rhodovibrionaceae bacterium]